MYRRLLGISVLIAAALLLAGPVAASDDARCVQQMLADAHYDVGAIDGQVGARTRRAATELAEGYPALGLPPLASDTYAEWCRIAKEGPFRRVLEERAPLALVAWRDLKGPTDFWRAHEKTSVCQVASRGSKFDPTPARNLDAFDAALVSHLAPIFPSATGARSCIVPATRAVQDIPPPIVDAEITGDYHGCDYCKFQPAYDFIGPAIAAYRAASSPETAEPLKVFLVSWAEADALSKNIWAPWEPHPVDYNVLKLTAPMIIAYSEVGALMAPDEAERVGRWLHRLVGEAVKSKWGDRQDNKSYMRVYVGLLWGLLTDDEFLKTIAYSAFDDALYDLRPDGSPVQESMRGGSGLHYSNRVATMLTAIAVAGAADGTNLFAREVEGRSLTNAANWATVAASFPSLNLRYAKSCPDGGDGPGYDREHPDLAHMFDGQYASWAIAYAMNPDAVPETVGLIASSLQGVDAADVHAGGSLACYAAGMFDETRLTQVNEAGSDFDGYNCRFLLGYKADGWPEELLASGRIAIGGNQLSFEEVQWGSRLRPRGETLADWPLTFTKERTLRGPIPVFTLHERDDPPVIYEVGSLESSFGETPEGGWASFMVDPSENGIGKLRLFDCTR